MQIFLIRHPQPAATSALCYGHSDIALAEHTRHTLPEMAARLRHELPANIPLFSSPLMRCRVLAELLHPEPIYDDRLKEMNFGEWEMQPWSQIPRLLLDTWAADTLHYTPPGGESVIQVQRRIFHFIKEKQQQQLKKFSLVTHAGVMKILVGARHHLPEREWIAMHFDYGSLHMLDWSA